MTGYFRASFSVMQSERMTVTFISWTIPSPCPPLKTAEMVGSADIELRSIVTSTDSYSGTCWVGPGTSEHAGVCEGTGTCWVVVTGMVVGGTGGACDVHPPIRTQRMRVKTTRGRQNCFIRRNLPHWVLILLSCSISPPDIPALRLPHKSRKEENKIGNTRSRDCRHVLSKIAILRSHRIFFDF
jgi:hypothetical protein